jgi:ubiquinone/menaquinone biosynthesis C-methylase UbiE
MIFIKEANVHDRKFNPQKLQKLNNPDRLKDIPPDYIMGKLNLKESEVLVEIGAGTAFFSKAFLRQLDAKIVYACDLSETMLQWIKDNVTPKYPNIIPVKTGESTIPLEDRLADMVFSINLHHELENPGLMLKEAYRLLKPGGKICIVDWLKKEMAEGPPAEIRCFLGDVKAQVVQAGFGNVKDYEDLAKHFLVVGEKGH